VVDRTEFVRRIASVLDHQRAHGGGSGAVLVVELDGFRRLQDTYGHLVANELLRLAGDRIASLAPCADEVAFLGIADFGVLVVDPPDIGSLHTLVHAILDAFNTTWQALGHELFMTAAVGVTVFPDHADNALDLLRNAATALNQAKDHGKNQYRFYQIGWNEKLVERHKMEVGLRHSIERDELELHYQPQVDVDGKVLGFEALLRWRHPTLGLLSPARFLDLAEETGLWLPLGEWVLRQASRQARWWRDLGLAPVPISVNVTANQLQQKGFLRQVQAILDETGLEPSSLELEITEGALVKAMQSSVHSLQLLRKMGTKVALDDFGTGYSSLSYLKDLPVDVLKIDKSFVDAIGKSHRSDAVLSAVLSLAGALNLDIVGEGVETFEQLDFLAARHCTRIQGFLFSPARPADEAADLLAAGTIVVTPEPSGYSI
jgi:diguanylate cyclase (GGDEF)-like protein